MSRDEEAEALGELRRLLVSLGGAGVTRELATSIRRSAEEIARRVEGSVEAADLYGKILRASQPAPPPEPDSCRALREKLNGGVDATTRTVMAALAASGFAGRGQIPPHEEECFRGIIHASLQSLRARLESTEGVPPERLRSRVLSLRELLDALPPDILAPRQLVEKLIRQLEISAARDAFDELLKGLRKRVAEQDIDAAEAARADAESNAWALAHPSAPEVKEAQQHFARLEELQRAYSAVLADAGRARMLAAGGQKDYDQALGEIQMAEARLRQTGLLKREALDEAIALLVDRLAKEFEWEERASDDPSPTEAALEARLSKLQRLSVRLQKVPAGEDSVAGGLRQKCASLMEKHALLLNDARLRAAREKLRRTHFDDVPAYVETLRSSELLALREWSLEVQRVLDSIQYLKDADTGAADRSQLERVERAEKVLGRCPLARRAVAAATAYRLKVARNWLRESRALVKEVEDACLKLSGDAATAPLSDAIKAAVQSVLRYRRTRDEASAAFAEARRQFPEECAELDECVRRARWSRLPEAANRWAERASAAASEADIEAMRLSLAEWREALGADFPYDDISRRFNERSAEMEIQALEAEGKFDEALRLLEAKPALLSDEFLLVLEQRLRRARAARDYEPGGEDEVVAVVRRYGSNSDLLRILVEDFRRNCDCRHLARLHGSLTNVESVNDRAALLVRWSYDFQSDSLDSLAGSLARSDSHESVTLFAKVIAAGERPAAALRVLGDTLRLAADLPHVTRKLVEASHKMASDRFAAACREIATGLDALEQRCDPNRLTRRPAPFEDDAELSRQIEAAFAVARNFLSAATNEVASWHDYLGTAKSLGVACDAALLGGAQELDHRLVANKQILTQLAAAWRGVAEKGWEKLSELENTLTVGAFTRKITQVAAVTQLLHEYIKNYRPTTECVTQLVEARQRGGDGLTRAELARLVGRLTGDDELGYDFRRGQDRFRQVARFGGRTFNEFVAELEVMTAEIEAMAAYEEQLNNLLVGEKEPLRLRLEQGSETNRQEVVRLLRRFDAKGASLLELYKNPPRVSRSQVASARLRELQDKPWFDLLRRAAALAEGSKDEGVVHDGA
jgi:hypothetical protein